MTAEPTTAAGRRHEDYCRTFMGDDAASDVAAIEAEARADERRRIAEAVRRMKSCAPDGDYIRWDTEYDDPEVQYVNRSGVLAIIERQP